MRRVALVLCMGALLGPACTSHDGAPEGPQEPAPEPVVVPVEAATQRVAPAPADLALAWTRANECGAAPPMSLTASDGTGLRLVSIDADAVVEGPLALTQMHLVFANPEPRQLEGRFALQLPAGAALSRFAMAIDGRWQEGEVLERRAAQAAYEDFLHRKQDPALLEHDAGNRFEARVFPIPAGGTKELTVSWSQQLSSVREPWVLPVCGLPQLDALDVRVLVRGIDENDGAPTLFEVARREENFAPKQDLELRTGGRSPPIVRAGELVLARVVPEQAQGEAALDELAILFDTSASRALDFTGQVDRLGRLVDELRRRHPQMKLRLVAFDQAPEIVFDGPISGFDDAVLARLRERGAFGATDIVDALVPAHGMARVLLVGDGIVTAGVAERRDLMRITGGITGHGVQRIDALVDGGLQDRELLEEIVRQPDDDGVVVDARATIAHVVDRLERRTVSGLQVNVPGATWTWPATLDGVSSGDEVLVYARLAADAPVRVEIDGAAVIDERSAVWNVPAPLLRRAHGQARITELQRDLGQLGTDAGDEARAALVREIVAVSTRERVLSDYTALLVLETEDDYRRFGIERTALADILAVGDRGIDVLQRAQPVRVASNGDDLRAARDEDEQKNKKTAADAGKIDSATLEQPLEHRLEEQLDGGGSTDDGITGKGDESRHAGPAAGFDIPELEPSAPPSPEATRRDRPAPRPSGGRSSGERFDDVDVMARFESGTPEPADPYDGDFARVMTDIAADRAIDALPIARAWHERAPGDVLALVALGEVHEAMGKKAEAARAYGSLIDLHPSRADIRRMAGERLERLGSTGTSLAIDTYEKAVAQRPDHPSGRRLLAYALVQQGRFEEAFAVIEAALDQSYPAGRFAEVNRILREDLGLVAAAWLHAQPDQEPKIAKAVGERHVAIDHRRSVRFVLVWETDANDVDLHVWDRFRGHAYYSARDLRSGGSLYADVTTGFGPEVFAIEGSAKAGPYKVRAHYYARGPMGYGMGKLQVIEHDGSGELTFSEHPFVIMKDQAHIDLVEWPTKP